MAALNKNETTTLQDAVALIEYVKANGFDPTLVKSDPQARYTLGLLDNIKSRLGGVVALKGYYPS